MRKSELLKYGRVTIALFAVSQLGIASGCATMAHRSSTDGQYTHSTSECNGEGNYCPWVWADAGLLAAGIIPGVIALGVDMHTGALKHQPSSATLASFGEHRN